MTKRNRTIELEARIPKDYIIEYWYDKSQDLPESEQEHVIEMLEEGYAEGELNDANENRGWWKKITES